jgi:ribosomal 50S subunit-associated protein YjgA (DUF615 family)
MIVHRKAYTRKDGTRVKASTFNIKNRGKPGKGPKLFTLKEGRLERFGYPEQGRIALSMAVRSNSALTVFRRLQALATLTKRTDPNRSRKYLLNRNWVKKTWMQ